MSSWMLVCIGHDWWPERFLSRAPWPGQAAVIRLGDIASVRSITGPLRAPTPLVTPANVDPVLGTIKPSRVTDDDALVLGDDLDVGDVLVPTRGEGPCVLVSEDSRGLAFRGFLLVRAAADADALMLWAALTSLSGVEARKALSTGTSIPTLTATSLARFEFPAPLSSAVEAIRAVVPHPLVVESEEDNLRSSWAMHDLRDASIWLGAAQTVERTGTPLSELGDLWSGGVRENDCHGVPATGRLPVLTHRAVRGHGESLALWGTGTRTSTRATVAFTKAEPFRSNRVAEGVLLSSELLALDVGAEQGMEHEGTATPDGDRLADSLVRYFSTREGIALLSTAAHGAAIRRLSLSALSSVRVDLSALNAPQAPVSGTTLAEQLQRILCEALAW